MGAAQRAHALAVGVRRASGGVRTGAGAVARTVVAGLACAHDGGGLVGWCGRADFVQWRGFSVAVAVSFAVASLSSVTYGL